MAANLDPEPEYAESWEFRKEGREVHFKIRAGLHDHSGQAVTAENIGACLEQYRVGKPISPYISSFPQWRGTRHTDREVILDLEKPDPYLLRNLSLLHYFRTASSAVPCTEPKDREEVIGSGPYKMAPWDPLPETSLLFEAVDPRYMSVRFHFVVDDNTRALEFLRGKIDGSLDALGLSKERWLEKNYSDRFTLLQRKRPESATWR